MGTLSDPKMLEQGLPRWKFTYVTYLSQLSRAESAPAARGNDSFVRKTEVQTVTAREAISGIPALSLDRRLSPREDIQARPEPRKESARSVKPWCAACHLRGGVAGAASRLWLGGRCGRYLVPTDGPHESRARWSFVLGS